MLDLKSSPHYISHEIFRRIHLILNIQGRDINFNLFGRELQRCPKTIKRWYIKIEQINKNWHEHVEKLNKEQGHAEIKLRKMRFVERILSDNPRSGKPATYTSENYSDIQRISLEKPSKFDRPITNWTARELCDEVHKQEICQISSRQIQRFLKSRKIQPHRYQNWMEPNISDIGEFRKEAKNICDLYHEALYLADQGIHLVSVDEKTNIQALERLNKTKQMTPGSPEKIEFEYKRNGTLQLTPSFEITTGKIINYRIADTRNEVDFCQHIEKTINLVPDAGWIFIADQLNVHFSESLVKMIAEKLDIKGDLGVKGKRGILKNLKSRKEFLTNESHRIRFAYTPKHCSWLNQVEIWFSTLSRKVIKRGHFGSKKELGDTIENFINYYNETMAKPYKWTYTGIPLSA